jgi:hypothetical protein
MRGFGSVNDAFSLGLIGLGVGGIIWATYTTHADTIVPVAALLIGFGLGIYADRASR